MWNPHPETLEACFPTFCHAPPSNPPHKSLWTIQYQLFLQKDISPIKTSLSVQCPTFTHFMEDVAFFKAECFTDGWHVSHPVGCVHPHAIDDSAGQKICMTLTLHELRCKYPMCPNVAEFINLEKVQVIHLNDEHFHPFEVDQMTSLKCIKKCKCKQF